MSLKLGRRPTPPEIRALNPRMERYLFPANPPAAWNAATEVPKWPMYDNDSIGDCTCAAAGHMNEAWTANVNGQPTLVPDSAVIALYETQGYVPGDPSTDQGATCQAVLETWRTVGLGGDKLLGYAEVGVRDTALLKAAVWLFSGLYIGFNCPQSALDQFNAGQPWDVVKHDGGIAGGHCVNVVAYDASGLTVVTWGALQRMTWTFWAKYVDEAYAAIPSDYNRLGDRLLSNGFNEAQLIADIDQIGGTIPPSPSPPPPPAPPPAPSSDPAWLQDLERMWPGVLSFVKEFEAWMHTHHGASRP